VLFRFRQETGKIKNPNNPVNPVKYFLLKKESIPHLFL